MPKEHFHIVLPSGSKVAVKVLAARRGVSISRLFEIALGRFIDAQVKKQGIKKVANSGQTTFKE